MQAVLEAIEAASILVLVTPIYRATYSGLLKVLFDQLPPSALAGKAVVLAATAGGPAHFLALDTGGRALVASLDGWTVPTVTYATPVDFDEAKRPSEDVRASLGKALAEAAMLGSRDDDAAAVDEFAAAARDWLAEHRAEAPPDYGAICPPELIDAGVAWQRLLYDAGYAGIHWPVEHGGQGLTPEHQAAWLIECAVAGVPPVLNMVGLVLAGGALLRYGTPEQQAQHLRATLAADHVWCQLFSEPGAGSDLGSLTHACRARRRPLHRQRPEGLVLGRAGQQLGHPHGPHRPRRGQARRHLVLPLPDGPARHRGAPAQADDRRGGVRRGLLHRRRAARPTACSARCTVGGASG